MPRALVLGATGFVGSRLVPALVSHGWTVIAASRRPPAHPFGRHVSWARVDVERQETLAPVLAGCSSAWYLVHRLGGPPGYELAEARAAESFADAAGRAGLGRIVYLGGVAPKGVPSRHLASRLRTGEILRAGKVPVFELRASMIVGPGSESWHIVRDLAARLPVMVLPRWMKSLTEPVSIVDVLAALVHAAELPAALAGVYGLPGPEALSARQILERVARLNGTRPVMLDVPFVTPKLSSWWIRGVTRAHGRIAAELVEALRDDLLCKDPPFWNLLPGHVLEPFDLAAERAMRDELPKRRLTTAILETAAYALARKNPAHP